MKYILVLALSLFITSITYSQKFYSNKLVQNSVFVEASYMGKIMAGTFNYERYIGHTDYLTFYAKVAGGYWKVNDEDGIMIPVTIQSLLFNSDSHVELGAGLNIVKSNILNEINFFPIVNIGYRIQPLSGGLLIRFNIYLSNGIYPGVSVGYSF